jgi:hypothetical protein
LDVPSPRRQKPRRSEVRSVLFLGFLVLVGTSYLACGGSVEDRHFGGQAKQNTDGGETGGVTGATGGAGSGTGGGSSGTGGGASSGGATGGGGTESSGGTTGSSGAGGGVIGAGGNHLDASDDAPTSNTP